MRRFRPNPRLVDLRRGLASYEPQALLATGGMAEVWRGQATFEGGGALPVAIKRIRPELASKPSYKTMFEDEARIGMLLRHDNIVRVYDARTVDDAYIIIMELVNGPSMRGLMGKSFARKACMPVELALRIGIGVARALAYAHGSLDDFGRSLDIVHRDVSPQNVLLGSDGAVKLMDFGLAFASANHYEHNPNEIGGKLGYMAPEILIKKQSTPAIDVFALGVTLWEALAGRRLFRGKSDKETAKRVIACKVPPLAEVNPRVPRTLSKVVGRALCADPLLRPTAEDFADDLLAELEALGVDEADDCVARLVRLHRRYESVSKRPSQPESPNVSSVAAELERELLDGAPEGGAVVTCRPPREQSGVVKPDDSRSDLSPTIAPGRR